MHASNAARPSVSSLVVAAPAYRHPAFRAAIAAGLLLLALGFAETAAAQNCGNWNRPVLCEAELIAADAGRRSSRLNERSSIRMAPRESFDLELLGRDQRGRRFPSDRMVLGYDTDRCRTMIDIERRTDGSLRLTAQATDGRCELYLWVPGNLNFEWAIEIEISAAARTRYGRNEAEFVVTRLYRAILGREPDEGGFGPAVAAIEAGDLDNLVTNMLRSSEFRQSDARADASVLIDQFYQGVFGRPADDGGRRLYIADMRRGQYADVLIKLVRSSEFERLLVR